MVEFQLRVTHQNLRALRALPTFVRDQVVHAFDMSRVESDRKGRGAR